MYAWVSFLIGVGLALPSALTVALYREHEKRRAVGPGIVFAVALAIVMLFVAVTLISGAIAFWFSTIDWGVVMQ